uniref:Uncharacterized protein n=1 Tax=Arundo donax TaxID=35708 RepID=A0A0A9EHB7_ARUDO
MFVDMKSVMKSFISSSSFFNEFVVFFIKNNPVNFLCITFFVLIFQPMVF